VQEAVDQDGERNQEYADCLVAAEMATLFFAASGALLLHVQGLQLIVHARRSLLVS